MNQLDLDIANQLAKEIEQTKENIKMLSSACSDGFVPRKMSLNILGTQQREGFVTIPKDVSKIICLIALNQEKDNLLRLEEKFAAI